MFIVTCTAPPPPPPRMPEPAVGAARQRHDRLRPRLAHQPDAAAHRKVRRPVDHAAAGEGRHPPGAEGRALREGQDAAAGIDCSPPTADRASAPAPAPGSAPTPRCSARRRPARRDSCLPSKITPSNARRSDEVTERDMPVASRPRRFRLPLHAVELAPERAGHAAEPAERALEPRELRLQPAEVAFEIRHGHSASSRPVRRLVGKARQQRRRAPPASAAARPGPCPGHQHQLGRRQVPEHLRRQPQLAPARAASARPRRSASCRRRPRPARVKVSFSSRAAASRRRQRPAVDRARHQLRLADPPAAAVQPGDDQRDQVAHPEAARSRTARSARSATRSPAAPRAPPARRASAASPAARRRRRARPRRARDWPSDRLEAHGAGRGERDLVDRLAVVLAGILDRGDLERPLDRRRSPG